MFNDYDYYDRIISTTKHYFILLHRKSQYKYIFFNLSQKAEVVQFSEEKKQESKASSSLDSQKWLEQSGGQT